MKKLFVSLFMSAVLLFGLSAMAQSPAAPAKEKAKAKTELKKDATKKAPCKKDTKACPAKATKATPAKATPAKATKATPATPAAKAKPEKK